MSEKAWKRVERRVAQLLGGRRLLAEGEAGETGGRDEARNERRTREEDRRLRDEDWRAQDEAREEENKRRAETNRRGEQLREAWRQRHPGRERD